MSERPVVLTAFERFGDWETNPTIDVVDAAARTLRDAGRVVRTRVLPVDLVEAPQVLHQALAGEPPGAVVCCGLSGRATDVHVERVAVNVASFRIPDASGRRPRGEPLVEGGPQAFLCGAPVHRLVEAVRGVGVPARVSDSAGTYVCNAVYYFALQATSGAGVPAVFLHLPPLPGTVRPASAEEVFVDPWAELTLEEQARAVVAVATALLSGHPVA